MNYPSVKRMVQELGLPNNNAKIIRSLMCGETTIDMLGWPGLLNTDVAKFPRTCKWIGSCYNKPDAVEIILECINEAMEGYGVEYLEDLDLHYVNVGDPYEPTIIFRGGRFSINAWGDMVK